MVLLVLTNMRTRKSRRKAEKSISSYLWLVVGVLIAILVIYLFFIGRDNLMASINWIMDGIMELLRRSIGV